MYWPKINEFLNDIRTITVLRSRVDYSLFVALIAPKHQIATHWCSDARLCRAKLTRTRTNGKKCSNEIIDINCHIKHCLQNQTLNRLTEYIDEGVIINKIIFYSKRIRQCYTQRKHRDQYIILTFLIIIIIILIILNLDLSYH